jgi:hypothetical protein
MTKFGRDYRPPHRHWNNLRVQHIHMAYTNHEYLDHSLTWILYVRSRSDKIWRDCRAEGRVNRRVSPLNIRTCGLNICEEPKVRSTRVPGFLSPVITVDSQIPSRTGVGLSIRVMDVLACDMWRRGVMMELRRPRRGVRPRMYLLQSSLRKDFRGVLHSILNPFSDRSHAHSPHILISS